jgi:hypothetical protein
MCTDYFPALHNALSPILTAIFAGNGIVVKCSEYVVWSTTWFIGAVKECLRVCGHDPDLVQVCRLLLCIDIYSLSLSLARCLLARRGGSPYSVSFHQAHYVYWLRNRRS